VNAATVRVLSAEGCDVCVPEGQGCCGALSLHSAARRSQRFARALIERFENAPADTIVINAAAAARRSKNTASSWQANRHMPLARGRFQQRSAT